MTYPFYPDWVRAGLKQGYLAVDLFSGLRGGGSGFVKLGFRVIGVELNEKVNTEARTLHEYEEDHVMSIFDIDEEWCKELRGAPHRR